MNPKKEWVDGFLKDAFTEVEKSGYFRQVLLNRYYSLMEVMRRKMPEDQAYHNKRVGVVSWKLFEYLISQGWDITEYQHHRYFLAGCGHDFGKIPLCRRLLDGHDVDKEEFKMIKWHSRQVFNYFKYYDIDLALIMGLIHEKNHYGIKFSDLPSEYGVETRNKVYRKSELISIIDFIDAGRSRKTHSLTNGWRGLNGKSILKQLEKIYPKRWDVIEIALKIHVDLF